MSTSARRRSMVALAALALLALLAHIALAAPRDTPVAATAHLHKARHARRHRRTAHPRPTHTGARLTTIPWRPGAQITIGPGATGTPIPSSFLGMSTEYFALPAWARHLTLLDRVLALIHGPGPLVLRVGGDSADRTFWEPAHEPDWVFELTPRWLAEMRTIVRHTGARLILDLNLVTATPAIAARWAHIAQDALPHGTILGFEIGNEPDLYSATAWHAELAGTRMFRPLPPAITPGDYAATYDAYHRALALAAPGIPLLGPALAEPRTGLPYLARLLAGPHPGLTAVTVHRYPYSACATPASTQYPTIARILSQNATTGMAQAIQGSLRLARRAGLPLRMTEINSVTCGGVPGISNTYATALWAPDALFELAHAGVSSVDVHVRATSINAAFALGQHGLIARPLLYGMVAFRRMLGPGAELVPTQTRGLSPLHVKVWAVRSQPGVLRVLVLDKGAQAAHVGLSLPAGGPAEVQRLTGPSPGAIRGVRLAGQWLGADGRWHGRFTQTKTAHTAAGYRLSIAPYSGALVTVRMNNVLRNYG